MERYRVEGSKVIQLSKERAEGASHNMCMGTEEKIIVLGFAVKKGERVPKHYFSFLQTCLHKEIILYITILIVYCMLLSSSLSLKT